MDSAVYLPLILQTAGILVIFAEILIPSGGLLSMVASGFIFYSLYLVFAISTNTGIFVLIADLIIVPAAVFMGFRLLAISPVTLKTKLSDESGVNAQKPGLEDLVGREGVTLSTLRPSGIAILEGKRVDVVSRGEYLEKSSEIIVLSVTGNQVIVGKKETNS